ncbi:MAG: hypothetical protein MI975_15145 [Cytophagales bacterium]|nr:hypothetical protein [Cytophagales bacterium]
MLVKRIRATGDKGRQPESEIGLRCACRRWGEPCVNPEYDRVKKELILKE